MFEFHQLILAPIVFGALFLLNENIQRQQKISSLIREKISQDEYDLACERYFSFRKNIKQAYLYLEQKKSGWFKGDIEEISHNKNSIIAMIDHGYQPLRCSKGRFNIKLAYKQKYNEPWPNWKGSLRE